MNEDRPSNEPHIRAPASRSPNWRPLAWVTLGVVLVLSVASFTGNGTGMFGWGWMMGMMWVWMILPLFLLAWLVVSLTHRDKSVSGRAR